MTPSLSRRKIAETEDTGAEDFSSALFFLGRESQSCYAALMFVIPCSPNSPSGMANLVAGELPLRIGDSFARDKTPFGGGIR